MRFLYFALASAALLLYLVTAVADSIVMTHMGARPAKAVWDALSDPIIEARTAVRYAVMALRKMI